MKTAMVLAFAMTTASLTAGEFIKADDSRLSYSDCGGVEFCAGAARFQRPGPANHHYLHDNPGARLRLRTDADEVTAKLRYNDLHTSKTFRNSIGAVLVDGSRTQLFETVQKGVKREVEDVSVEVKSPSKGFHTYEFVMPYADSVDVLGVSVPDGAKFATPEPRPQVRCVFYGDSVTHGATASNVTGTYPFLVSQLRGFQVVNLGVGGRSVSAKEGAFLAAPKCDVAVVHIGVNNWQGGSSLEGVKSGMAAFLKEFRSLQPDIPLYVVTPLWVSPKWGVKKFPLEEYRRVIAEAVAESKDPHAKLIDGSTLIDHDERYFDNVLVHPNDAGFKQMAERLAKEMK